MLPVVPCLSDASLIIANHCNALGLILPPAGRSVSACLISYVNYGGTCKVSNLSLLVTQFRSRVGRFESSTGIPYFQFRIHFSGFEFQFQDSGLQFRIQNIFLYTIFSYLNIRNQKLQTRA